MTLLCTTNSGRGPDPLGINLVQLPICMCIYNEHAKCTARVSINNLTKNYAKLTQEH